MKEFREPKIKKNERDEFRPERRKIIEKTPKTDERKEVPKKAGKITKEIIEKKEAEPEITKKKTPEEKEKELEKARKIIKEIIEKKKAEPEITKKKTPEEKEKELEKAREIIKEIIEKKKAEAEIETKLEAIKEVLGPSKEFRDLVGNNSAEAWDKREKLLKTNNPRIIKEVLRTLAGLPDSPESLKLLSDYSGDGEKQPYWRAIAEGLIGKTSERAEEIRNFLEFADPETKKLRGGNWLKWINRLGLQKSEGFFKLRKEIDKRVKIGWFLPSDVVLSEMGSNTPEANKRRTAYKDIAPVEALLGTAGIKPGESPEVDAIRRKLALDFRLRWAYDLAVKGNNY